LPTNPSPSDEDLLVAIQQGDLDAREQFEDRFSQFLTSVARRRCDVFHLADDHVNDIVQDVYAHALNPDLTAFNPAQRTARGYLGGLAFNAAKTIMLQYRDQVPLMPETDEMNAEPALLDDRAVAAIDDIETQEFFEQLLKDEAPVIRFIVLSHFLKDIELYRIGQHVCRSAFRISRDLKKVYARMRERLRDESFAPRWMHEWVLAHADDTEQDH